MAESVLSKLVKTDKETRDRMVSIDKTLQAMLRNDLQSEKNEVKRRKKEEQRNKRKSGDRSVTKKLFGDKKGEKKEKKGLLDGLLGGLGDGITGLIKGPAMIAALGAGLAGGLAAALAFPQVRKGIFDMLRRALKFIETDVIPTVFRIIKDQVIPFYTDTIFPLIEKGAKKIGNVLADIFYDKALVPLTKWASENLPGWLGVKALPSRGTGAFDLNEDAKKAKEATNDPTVTGTERDDALKILADKKEIEDRTQSITDMETAIKSHELSKKKAAERLARKEKLIKNAEDSGFGWTVGIERASAEKDRKKVEEMTQGITDRKEWIRINREIVKQLNEKYKKEEVSPVKKQSGGPITVPGRTTGDKHPALLPPGSFVLNRNAAGYQNGGIPALLESGEKVFGPGQWGMKEFMLNSAIPRFQEGGEVDPTRKPKESTVSSIPRFQEGGDRKPKESTVSSIPRFQEGGEVDPTRKPKEGEISKSDLGDFIFKGGKWMDHTEPSESSDKPKKDRELSVPQQRTAALTDWGAPEPKKDTTEEPKKDRELSVSQRRTRSVLDGWGAPEPKKPTKDTTEEPTIKEGKDKKKGEGGASAVIAAGKQLLKDGFTVAEHPNFDKQRGFRPEGDARVGGHSPGSLHYSNLALDVTDWRGGDWLGRTKDLAGNVYQKKDDMKLTQIIHDPWGSWFDGKGKGGGIGGHDTHLHLGFASGPAGDTGSLSDGKGDGDASKGSGLLGFLSGMTGEVGKALGSFIKGISGALGDILGGDAGSLISSLFGSVDGGGDNNTESGAGVGPAGAGGAGATSVNDPNAKALLNAIADAEGTSQYADQGYKTHFGGKQWQGQGYPKDHPRVDTGGSNAFGRYQFMSPTWDEYKGNNDMSPAGQDQVALDLVTKKRGVNLSDGLSKKEVEKLSWEWASIKGNNYTFNGASQGKVGQDKFLGMYKAYGGEIQGLQTGGVANIKTTSSGSAFPQKSEDAFINNLAEAMQPVVVPIPMGGGGGGSTAVSSGGNSLPPSLPANPNNPIALDLAYRLSAGASFA